MNRRTASNLLHLPNLITLLILIAAIWWGRTVAPLPASDSTSLHWQSEQLLSSRAMAGAVPGLAADLAVLEVFNLFAGSDSNPEWRQGLHYQLRTAQAMDPHFRDVYRLTEGLLAYEAHMWPESVALLAASETALNSADPLLAAGFIANTEMHDRAMAIDLAKRAIDKPDARNLTIGFASRLITAENGCSAALAYLQSRLKTLPERLHQSVEHRIRRLQQSDNCLARQPLH